MSKHFTRKPAAPALQSSSQPAIDPQDVFSKEQLETVLRFLRRKVVIGASIRLESADKDLNSIVLITQSAKQIEKLALDEIQKLG